MDSGRLTGAYVRDWEVIRAGIRNSGELESEIFQSGSPEIPKRDPAALNDPSLCSAPRGNRLTGGPSADPYMSSALPDRAGAHWHAAPHPSPDQNSDQNGRPENIAPPVTSCCVCRYYHTKRPTTYGRVIRCDPQPSQAGNLNLPRPSEASECRAT